MDRDYQKWDPLPMKELGASLSATDRPIKGLDARIRHGASLMEFTFMGSGKGSSQSFTPESIGREEREALRYMAKENKVKTTTHASPSLAPISGLTQNGFSQEAAQKTMEEISKAIHFAAEASTGGAVVFHAGEWQRSIGDTMGGEGKLKGYDGEEKKKQIFYADKDGKIAALEKDKKYFKPIIDENLTKEFNEKYGDDKSFQSIIHKKDEYGNVETDEYTYDRVIKEIDSGGKLKEEINDVYRSIYNEDVQFLNDDDKYFKFVTLDSLKQTKHQAEQTKSQILEYKDRLEVYKTRGNEAEVNQMKRVIESLEVQEAHVKSQIYEQQEKLKEYKPIEVRGLEFSAKNMATLGIEAMEATIDQRKKGNDIAPIFLSPEGYDVNLFGSSPRELATLVEKSREQMVEQIWSKEKGTVTEGRWKGVVNSEADAKKFARDHIRATVDIGHLNMMKAKFDETKGDNFDDWLIGELKDAADRDTIGHAHLSDNMGFNDEHLTVGDGNAPVKRFIQTLRESKSKVDEFMVEGGSFNWVESFQESLEYFNSPVYSLDHKLGMHDFSTGPTWTGHGFSPYRIVGKYAPSEQFKGKPYWGGVDLN